MTWNPLDLIVQGRDAWKNGVATVFDYERLYCQKFLLAQLTSCSTKARCV